MLDLDLSWLSWFSDISSNNIDIFVLNCEIKQLYTAKEQ